MLAKAFGCPARKQADPPLPTKEALFSLKLKEFNFKMLNGILSCKKNLKQRRIKTDDECDVCKEQQTIKHLWDCLYVKSLWEIIDASGFEISYGKVFLV